MNQSAPIFTLSPEGTIQQSEAVNDRQSKQFSRRRPETAGLIRAR